MARETFGVERVVARIYDPKRAVVYERLGIPTVASVAWTTERVLRRVLPDGAAVEWIDPTASFVAGRAPRRPRLGRHAGRSRSRRDGGRRGRPVTRLGSAQLPAPSDASLQEDDLVHVAVADGDRRSTPSTPACSPATPRRSAR